MKQRFVYEYKVLSEEKTGEMSATAESEIEARDNLIEKAADFEFTSKNDIMINELIDITSTSQVYFECEGCQ